jgi:hypothetical protein
MGALSYHTNQFLFDQVLRINEELDQLNRIFESLPEDGRMELLARHCLAYNTIPGKTHVVLVVSSVKNIRRCIELLTDKDPGIKRAKDLLDSVTSENPDGELVAG